MRSSSDANGEYENPLRVQWRRRIVPLISFNPFACIVRPEAESTTGVEIVQRLLVLTPLSYHADSTHIKMSVAGQVAIVTGGGRGLGRLYALALARRGAKVLVNDYGGDLEGRQGSTSVAQCVVDEIKAQGGVAVAHGGDVAKDYTAIVDAALHEFGTVHILINNAGITGKMSPHDKVDPAAFRRVLDISVLGTAMLTSVVYPIMAKQRYGRIINSSSNAIYGLGVGDDCAYAASKAATFAMTRQLGRWSERDGIKINCTMPAAASRMGDLSEGTKFVTRTYFPAEVRC
jgi:NAD(P)-dependent dehydrogenase (short-subunit alcohol dehydrogenase family)